MLRDRNPPIRVWCRTEEDRAFCLAEAIESRLVEGRLFSAEVEDEGGSQVEHVGPAKRKNSTQKAKRARQVQSSSSDDEELAPSRAGVGASRARTRDCVRSTRSSSESGGGGV